MFYTHDLIRHNSSYLIKPTPQPPISFYMDSDSNDTFIRPYEYFTYGSKILGQQGKFEKTHWKITYKQLDKTIWLKDATGYSFLVAQVLENFHVGKISCTIGHDNLLYYSLSCHDKNANTSFVLLYKNNSVVSELVGKYDGESDAVMVTDLPRKSRVGIINGDVILFTTTIKNFTLQARFSSSKFDNPRVLKQLRPNEHVQIAGISNKNRVFVETREYAGQQKYSLLLDNNFKLLLDHNGKPLYIDNREGVFT